MDHKNPFPRESAEYLVFNRLWRKYEEAADGVFQGLGGGHEMRLLLMNTIKFDRDEAHKRCAALVTEAVKEERELSVVKEAMRRLGILPDDC